MSSPEKKPPPAKRARLNPRLTAPFKSPLKRSTPTNPSSEASKGQLSSSESSPVSTRRHQSTVPSKLSTSTDADTSNASNASTTSLTKPTNSTKTLASPSQHVPSKPNSLHRKPHPPHPPLSPSAATQHATLKRTHTTLLRDNAALKSQLDTAEQALTIKNSTRDEELSRLIGVWREASRAAAEELFAVARDRVNGMGGVGGWRERERGRRERFGDGGWDQAGGEGRGYGGGDGEEEGEGAERLSEGDRERLRAEREEWAQGGDEEKGKEKEVWEEVGDEETFTMDMMLRSMNIDLDLIGYDKEEQRWVD